MSQNTPQNLLTLRFFASRIGWMSAFALLAAAGCAAPSVNGVEGDLRISQRMEGYGSTSAVLIALLHKLIEAALRHKD